jgi:type I restriction enzyme M protein
LIEDKKNKDEILFIDARNIFTQVDRALRKFSDEQIKNLAIITRLYEGDSESFYELIKEYEAKRDKGET